MAWLNVVGLGELLGPDDADEDALRRRQQGKRQDDCQHTEERHAEPGRPVGCADDDECERDNHMSDNEEGEPGRAVVGADIAKRLAAMGTTIDRLEIASEKMADTTVRTAK